MSETSDIFTINKNNVLSRYNRLSSNRDYQKNIISEAIDGLNSNCDTVVELPTGMGKTMVFSPIAAECAAGRAGGPAAAGWHVHRYAAQ